MKKIFYESIIVTCLFVLSSISYIIVLVLNYEKTSNILSLLTSVLASIAFGFWVSYIMQKETEKANAKEREKLKKEIRTRAFALAKSSLGYWIQNLNTSEEQLIALIPGLESSFAENSIDIDNLTLNYFIFKEIERNIDYNFKTMDKKRKVKTCIELFYMRDKLRSHLETTNNGDVFVGSSESYEEFSEFNEECIKLRESMISYNLTYQFEIFSKDEIEAMKPFSKKIYIGTFLNFNPPYELITLFENINKVEQFLKADFIPYHQKVSVEDQKKREEAMENEEWEKYLAWRNKYQDKAKKFMMKSNLEYVE